MNFLYNEKNIVELIVENIKKYKNVIKDKIKDK